MYAQKALWLQKENDYLQNMEKQCHILHTKYTEQHSTYQSLARSFNIPIIAISALNSLAAVVLNQFIPQDYVSIVNAILSAGTGVLGSIQLYLKINEKLNNALTSASTFEKLALKISKELSIDMKDRTSEGHNFVQECYAEFTLAVEKSNPLPPDPDRNYMALHIHREPLSPKSRLRSLIDSVRTKSYASSPESSDDIETFRMGS